ncbi:GNAT family N-acetyltransferase [Chitinophaga sp. MM2321]|uniref:GNAT family N-acetyltransferase n=1 Tax=Chitinophaga sp. MM2321 TaxID=3137178 RepID=UPI0032D57CE5
MKETILDNPAWGSLISEHKHFAEGTDRVKRYRNSIVPFVACRDAGEDSMEDINPWISAGESFYIIGELPVLPKDWKVESELPCAQMLLTPGWSLPLPEEDDVTISLLGDADATAMYELINSVQPGYYNPDTRLLGTYYGIRQQGKLVAMAGERMRMTGFCELSAICTDPAYTGKGYAQRLITQLCRRHVAAGIASFLHVSLLNERAIRLYEHMGFTYRRSISFTKVKKNS